MVLITSLSLFPITLGLSALSLASLESIPSQFEMDHSLVLTPWFLGFFLLLWGALWSKLEIERSWQLAFYACSFWIGMALTFGCFFVLQEHCEFFYSFLVGGIWFSILCVYLAWMEMTDVWL